LHYDNDSCFFDDHFVKIPMQRPHSPRRSRPISTLSWAAWQRVLAVLPAIALLWLAVAWANAEIAPW
jgi:hypothetical protein